jgi:hypothetical protein
MSFFSFTKLGNRRAEQVLPGGLVLVGGGRWRRNGIGMVNIMQLLYTHVCKWKNETY